MRLRESASQRASEPPLWLELGQSVILFRKYAADWFQAGNADDNRLILNTVGSNSVLADKKLSVQAKIPFKRLENADDCPRWCAIVEALGTDPEKEAEALTIIAAVRCLRERADARRAGIPVPPLSPSLSRRQTVRIETTGETASREPRPESAPHPRAQDRAA